MLDFHIHSDFSVDSKESLDNIAKKAIERNLKYICITDHVDFESSIDGADIMFRPDDYFRDLKKIKHKYKNDLEILIGVEIGMQPNLYSRYDEFINNYPFDFVIMSIHSIDGKDIFNSVNSDVIDPNFLLEKYYDQMLECVTNFNNYDTLGHIDFIDRYFNTQYIYDNSNIINDKINKILNLLIQNNKGLEINSASLRYNLDFIHPKPSILSQYKKNGGEIVTFGSDSHVCEYIGYEYRSAEKLLKNLGFKNISFYKQRKKYSINL
jgi:histidinol-phosphatase (PHP family)